MNGFFQWKIERKFRGKIVTYVDVLNGWNEICWHLALPSYHAF